YVHGVYALRASDGAIRWHHDTTDPVISPPLVVDGVVYAGVGASLVALRASDGIQLWQRPLTISGHQYLPLWLAFSAGTIYTYGRDQNPDQPYTPTFFGDSTVFAVQAADGAVRWSHRLDGTEPDQQLSTPVIADGIVYVRSNGNGSQAQARGVPGYGFGLHALRASDGTLLWTYPTAITQPVAAGGVVYAGDTSGNIIALHGTDGTVIWKQLVAGPASDFWEISLSLANGTLYVGVNVPDKDTLSSSAAVKALDASDGRQRWACPLPGSSATQLGTPVFAA
ncbi:MAG TPA: PQQ-binding-like beta-propeller repeat protein, partial [Ktedonobacterales bacterium]